MDCMFPQAFQAAPSHLGPVCFILYFVAFVFNGFCLGCCPYSSQGPPGRWFKFLCLLGTSERTGLSLEKMPVTMGTSLSLRDCQTSSFIFSSQTGLPAGNKHIIFPVLIKYLTEGARTHSTSSRGYWKDVFESYHITPNQGHILLRLRAAYHCSFRTSLLAY